MSEQNTNNDTGQQSQGSLNDNEPIVPIDFTPANLEQSSWSFTLSPVKLTIIIALFCFACIAWFILSAKSILIDVSPITSNVTVNTPLAIKIGPRYLVREGEVEVNVVAQGYYELDTSIAVSDVQAQTFIIELRPLPGFFNLDTNLATTGTTEANIFIDDNFIGTSPLINTELSAGEHSLRIEKERYQFVETTINIEGRSTEQSLEIELLPDWATVSFTSSPAGATVILDGIEVGLTPLSNEVLAGNHQLIVKLSSHKAINESFDVTALEDKNLPLFELIEADGLVFLQSTPTNSSVTLDGIYQGQTPIELSITPGSSHQLAFFNNGYEELQQSIQSQPDAETTLNVNLIPIVSSVQISAQPADALLFINGELMGNANQKIELLAASQVLEVRKEGYVSFETSFISRPGLEQSLEINLISLEQQRLNEIKPTITNASGQKLKLLYPGSFTMGASRREAGRQANESLRNITLNAPFYLSLTEVSNAEFASFDAQHSSGVLEGRTLDNPSQPVVRVSWGAAAKYCNWLSQQESLPEFYLIEDDQIIGTNIESDGYRLPTEAEWAWAARVNNNPDSLLKFPWGSQLPPPENHGNYADISAASFLNRLIVNYNDSFAGSAPVASFEPNAHGFYDLGGNVAEWTHIYFGFRYSFH